MHIGLHVKYPLPLSDFNESWISSTDNREKKSNIKTRENPYGGGRRTDGQNDLTKIIVAFRNFEKAPQK